MEKIHAFIHFHSFHGFRFRQGLFCTGSGGCPAECPSPQLRRKACASSSQARSHGSPSERSARQCSKSSPLANYASSTPTTKCCLSDKRYTGPGNSEPRCTIEQSGSCSSD